MLALLYGIYAGELVEICNRLAFVRYGFEGLSNALQGLGIGTTWVLGWSTGFWLFDRSDGLGSNTITPEHSSWPLTAILTGTAILIVYHVVAKRLFKHHLGANQLSIRQLLMSLLVVALLANFANSQTFDWIEKLGAGYKIGIVLVGLAISIDLGKLAWASHSVPGMLASFSAVVLLAPAVLARLFPMIAPGASGIYYPYKEAFIACVTTGLCASGLGSLRSRGLEKPAAVR